jgi:1-acyl-sn-glycerol-3-phosphate acyltransferase
MWAIIAGSRLLVLLLVLVALFPLQWIALRLHWAIARRIPVVFHRLAVWALNIRVHISGTNPRDTPSLVLANHCSWLDIIVLGSLRPLSFVAKSEVESWPGIGFLAKMQRTIFIDRENKRATGEVAGMMARRLSRGELIVLFAEGTTSDGNRVLPFRASLVGAARMALMDHSLDRIALQPLTVAYTRRNGLPVSRRERPDICWYGDMDLVPHLVGVLQGGPIDVSVEWGEPIQFDAHTDRKRASITARETVRAALSKANRQHQPTRPPASR